jgi:phosphate acyltransferase
MTTIALDVMGGDFGAKPAVLAAIELVSNREAATVILVGDENEIKKHVSSTQLSELRLRIHHTPHVLNMDTSPKQALDKIPKASIFEATKLVQLGKADVTVTTGNTGGAIMACARDFNRLPGVRRGVLAAVFPTARTRGQRHDPFALMLDSGVTLDATAEDLVAFAIMGQTYARCISKNQNPRIALLSNGSEPNKGRPAQVAAYQSLEKLKAQQLVNFIGSIEGLDIPKGTADVILTDGFTGNIVLKLLEGMGETISELARDAFRDRWRWRIGLMMLRSGLRQVKSVTDWRQYGGAPVLGFDHLLIKAHGRSNQRAIENALKVADRCVRSELVEQMRQGLAVRSGMTP